MFDLDNYSLLTIFLVGLAVVLGASEIGRWLGGRTEDRGSSNVSTLESAVFGLLALMLGFTFAMALSRFEARSDGTNDCDKSVKCASRVTLAASSYVSR